MAKKQPRDRHVNWLGPEWVTVYAGEQSWITSTGKVSTQRHGLNTLTGETVSQRKLHDMQNEARALQGQPKPQPTKRKGVTRTIKQKNLGATPSPRGISLYDPTKHGNTEVKVFLSFADAQSYAALQGFEGWERVMLSIKFTKNLLPKANRSSERARNGYAALTGLIDATTMEVGAQTATHVIPGTTFTNPWYEAAARMAANYDMSGKNARYYLTLFEKV